MVKKWRIEKLRSIAEREKARGRRALSDGGTLMGHNKTRGAKLLCHFCLIGIILTALLPSACVQQTTSGQRDEITSAVYIEHVGESNKSLLPVVIFAKKPSEAELKRVIGKVVWDQAIMVSAGEDDLRKITAAVYKSFQTTQEDTKGYKFIAFRVTIVEGKGEKKRVLPDDKIELSRVLPRDAMVLLFNAIEEIEKSSVGGNKELRIVIENLKGYLI